jgi:parvulin-like peptidyl-prolyl isomerase
MRFNPLWSVGCVLVLVLAGSLVFSAPPAWSLENGIIAVVDDDVITAKDLQDYLRGIYSQLKIEGRTEKEIAEVMSQYQSKGVEQLVEDRLILAEAKRQGMIMRPQIVKERMDEITARYPSSQYFLAEINREGVTISDIQKKIEDQFKAHYVVTKEVRDKIYVNPQEVTDYYNAHIQEFRKYSRVFIQSIFVRSDGPDDAAAMGKIKAALSRVKAGEDFKAVAQAVSELPFIGEVPEDSLNPEFKSRTDKMSVGDVSDIFSATDGFYIFKLTGRTPAVEPSLKEVKEEIYQNLFEVKFKENFRAWIKKLRKKSYVEIRE